MKARHTPVTARCALERAYLDGFHAGFERATVWERGLEFAVDAASEYASANSEPILAAAPELLAALETLCASLAWEEIRSGTTYNGFEAARAAIAKARGE